MSFLQPLILLGLPLIGLPIVIHLVNRNRHRTVQWAATMFLLQARRMARGMARLRYLLILLARMLAIAGLVFAVSRPMAGGWLGLTTGGAPETTIILLDRSVSMEAHDLRTLRSKRATGLNKLSELLQNTGRNTQLVLFNSASAGHQLVDSPADLTELPQTEPTDTAADIPSLVQQAAEYIATNETARTDVWICSDLRRSDWNPSGGRWETIRSQLEGREGVRIYLLAYSEQSDDNLAVNVSGVHRRESADGAELVMDLQLTRSNPSNEPISVPLSFVIDGARSTFNITVTGSEFVRNGHAIPIDREAMSGWGRVELPDDANPADNVFRFVYAEPLAQHTVVVSDTHASGDFLRLAAGTSSDRSRMAEAVLLTLDQVPAVDWDQTALLLWQAPLPDGLVAQQIQEFAASGRTVVLFPPEIPTDTELFGCRWTSWQNDQSGRSVGRWRTETDLLANTRSGSPLPAGELSFFRHCELKSERGSVLTSLNGGAPLLVRTLTDAGSVYFFSSLPGARHSNLVDNGVVFYVMIQRALARGSAALGSARQIECGTLPGSVAADWKPLDEFSNSVLVSQRTVRAGLYTGDGIRFALNRPFSEDAPAILGDDALAGLFSGLNFTRLDDSAGSTAALASEVWRMFLISMIVALLAEALLCVPDRRPVSSSSEPSDAAFRGRRADSPQPAEP